MPLYHQFPFLREPVIHVINRSFFHFRIQRVPETVAKQVERKNDQADQGCRKYDPVGVAGDAVERFTRQRTQAGHGGGHTDTQITQKGLRKNGRRNLEHNGRDQLPDAVGQQMLPDQPAA